MSKTCYLGYLIVFALLIPACSSSPSLPTSDAAQVPPAFDSKPSTESTGIAGATAPPQLSLTVSPTPPPMNPATKPSPEQLSLLAGLKSQGAAPELFNQVWLNSRPLKLADLLGKAVVVDFWTFG